METKSLGMVYQMAKGCIVVYSVSLSKFPIIVFMQGISKLASMYYHNNSKFE